MAVLKSGDTTLEIRYYKISTLTEDVPEELFTIFEVELRHRGHWIISPGLVSPKLYKFNERRSPGTYYIAEPFSCEHGLVQALQDLLEKNQIKTYYPYAGGLWFYLYPPHLSFPFSNEEDLQAVPSGPAHPNDFLTVAVQFDERAPQGSGLNFMMIWEIERQELQAFVDDLIVEWTFFREQFPPEPAPVTHQPLALDPIPRRVDFYIYQPQNTFGWISLRILVENLEWNMRTSSSFPPFDDLLKFFTDIATDRLPSFASVEEEGPVKYLHARRVDSPDLINFEVVDEGYPHYLPMFNILTDRRALVQTFYTHFVEFFETHFNSKIWNFGDDLFTMENLKALEQAIKEMKD
jgi:hypothetical protein